MDEDIRYQRLPQSFSVRELGSSEARGLWGIKHTRKPVDLMVAKAKCSSTPLQPQVELRITEDGCEIIGDKFRKVFPIHTVSYGVQDLVYTRVFCMIVVKEQISTDRKPFDCVAFVCESRQAARNLTYTLATAFQAYSRKVRSTGTSKSRFAIDLRTADELEMDLKKVDSEA
uniref:PID domain-containing protein n=1 Tax=Schizaphis graminum TaxID=13262 RepID=A0A2S2P8H3_SCHGA